MKKHILLISMIILLFSFSACSKANNDVTDNNKNDNDLIENEAVSQVGKVYFNEEDVIAVLLNNLDEDILNNHRKSINIEEYGDSNYETSLIIPRYNNMKISVYTANVDSENATRDELLYETTNNNNYGLLLKIERPEGAPLIIVVEGNDISEEFYYSYNGLDGTPDIEYIRAK